MKRLTLMACLAAAALTGCKTMPVAITTAIPSVDASMSEAETLVRANQREKAIEVLLKSAKDHPTNPEPVLRVAQMHYDRAEYGAAITHARRALEREPSNLLANSILAVSGLRVSTRALSDLAVRNNISGSVRSEAEDLARLIRTSLGEEVLVPGRAAAPKAAPAKPVRKASAKTTVSDDPFSALR